MTEAVAALQFILPVCVATVLFAIGVVIVIVCGVLFYRHWKQERRVREALKKHVKEMD